ncbi:hypothetical protein [Nocardioides korecus]
MSLGAEPSHHPLRPSTMSRARRPLTVAAGALLGAAALTACGSAAPTSGSGAVSSSPSSSPSASPSGGTSSSPSSTPLPTGGSCAGTPEAGPFATARVDLDGNGTREDVTVLTSPCGSGLAAVAGSRTWDAALATDAPPVRELYGVHVPGRASELVVTRATHPRGGFQLRVYAAQGSHLVELRRGTEPLLPFVATDVQEHPYAVTCGRDSLVVTEAVAHEPAGVLAAWDVRRTAYALGDGASLTPGRTREIADNVLPAALRRDWGGLVRHDAFKGCRVG